MAVIADIIESAGLKHTSDGWQDTRVFLVDGVSGPAVSRKYTAATVPGVPRRGDPHPVAPGCTVQEVMAEPYDDSNSIFRVVVGYGGDEQGTASGLEGSGIKGIEISTSTATLTTGTDLDGNKFIVEYQGPTFELTLNSVQPPREVSNIYRRSFELAEYEISVTRCIITVERPLPSLTETRRVAGHTNDQPWSGEPIDSWLILGVDSSVNGQGSHDWRYQIAHAQDGWQFLADIGRVVINGQLLPDNVTDGNGRQRFQIYPRINFATIGFEIPR